MSHFATLVILTPNYAMKHGLDDSLEKFSEELEVDEYSRGEVSQFDKISFVDFYSRKNKVIDKCRKPFYEKLIADGIVKPFESEEVNGMSEERYMHKLCYDNREEFGNFILSLYPKYLHGFKKKYEKHCYDWNCNSWRINPETDNWEEYSTYNQNSVYDWYAIGNRWDKCLKTKSGEFVNTCYLGEIDWTDFTDDEYEDEEKQNIWGENYRPLKDGVKYHFTKSNIPYGIFIDGEYYSQGEMGWFGLSNDKLTKEEWNEKALEMLSKLPKNSECTIVDCHI